MRFISFSSQKYKDRGDIVSLHFSPDSRTLAAVERYEEMVYFSWWDLEKQSDITSYADGMSFGYTSDPVLSPDHRFLAYVCDREGNSLRLVDRTAPKRSKKRERLLTALGRKKHSNIGEYQALQFSPDSHFLVAAVEVDKGQSGIYRWSVNAILRGRGPKSEKHLLADPAFIPTPEPNINFYSGQGRSLVFSADGKILTAGLWGNRVLVWEFPSGRELLPIKLRGRSGSNASRLAFHPKSPILAVANQSVAFYDLHADTRHLPPDTPVSPRTNRIRSPNAYDIEFHPSGHLLATACGDSLVRFWDGKTGVEKETFDWEIGKVSAVAFSPDGCLCGAVGEKGIAIWDVSQ
jgi:WD40 repeat protein